MPDHTELQELLLWWFQFSLLLWLCRAGIDLFFVNRLMRRLKQGSEETDPSYKIRFMESRAFRKRVYKRISMRNYFWYAIPNMFIILIFLFEIGETWQSYDVLADEWC